MKRLTPLLFVVGFALEAFSQGTINFQNGPTLLISTNSTALEGGTHGPTSPALGGFYYAVFTAASTVSSIDPSLQALLTGAWTFDGLYATNSAQPSGGRFN